MTTQFDTMADVLTLEKVIEDLAIISPLALPQKLVDYEFYDMQSSLTILDKIVEEFEDGAGAKSALMGCIGLALCDGVVRSWSSAKKYGITASKLHKEIDSFSYSNNIEAEGKEDENIAECSTRMPDDEKKYKREKVVSQNALNKCVDDAIKSSKTVEDGYCFKEKPIKDKNTDKWRSRNEMDVDHKVSAKNVFNQVNLFAYAPTDDATKKKMMRDVANTRENLITTDAGLNRSKGDDHNVNYVINNWNKLPPKTRKAMLIEGTRGQAEVAGKMAFGLSSGDITNHKSIENVAAKMKNSGAHVALNEQLGNIISTVLAPIWFEIKDITSNGICHDTGTENATSAIGIRLGRVLDYVMSRLPSMLKSFFNDLGNMLIDLIKSIVASFFKKALYVIKEGFGLLLQAFKILAKPSEIMSTAEKGDAILKLIGSLLPAFLIEVGLYTFLTGTLALSPTVADIVAGVVSALAAALLAYSLDRMDLFSVKSEKRLARVREIFDARIHNIKESTRSFDMGVSETLKVQRIQFETLRNNINSSLDQKDMNALNAAIDGIANFLKIDLPEHFGSPEKYLRFIKDNDRIVIAA